MRMIILAAGQGTRLRPLTNNKPKCMVEYKKKPIIDYIIDAAHDCSISDLVIVNGYKKEVLENYLKNKDISFVTNIDYDNTNMVSTLFSAKDFMNDDLIISYADIIYKKEVLDKLIESKDDFSVVVDKDWKQLWMARMENPLEDAETLKIKNGYIYEIGKKPKSYKDIEGQYIGLVKISKNMVRKVIKYYESLDKNALYDGKNFQNMYMTSLIQTISDNLVNVKPVYINGGWLEIDCIDDLESYRDYVI